MNLLSPIKGLQVDGGTVNIHHFYSSSSSGSGIDVFDEETGKHIVGIPDVDFPNPKNEEDMEKVIRIINKEIRNLQ